MRAVNGTVWLFSVAGTLSLFGCGEAPRSSDVEQQRSPAIASGNGLPAINGLNAHNGLDTINGLDITNGLNAHNGLAAINGLNAHNGLAAINGLNAHNGLAAINGLNAHNGLIAVNGLNAHNGLPTGALPGEVAAAPPQQRAAGWQPPPGATNALMTSAEGRATMSYIVRCALPAGHSVLMTDQAGAPYTFQGQIGIAPQWETGVCDTACQEYVTACLLAHVNTTGQHISLWLDSASPAIGWGRDGNFPYQEGTFYGNIFQSPPKAYYCDGRDHAFGVVPGRLGANQTNSPYTNPLGPDVLCKDRCKVAGGADGTDGFSSCPGIGDESFTRVVTVYRNFDPSTLYKICNRMSGLCLDVAPPGEEAGDGAPILEQPYDSAFFGQKWLVTMPSPGQYQVTNFATGLALSSSGSAMMLHPFMGASTQLWAFRSMADGTGYDQIIPLSSDAGSVTAPNNGSSTPGQTIGLSTWLYNDAQKWVLSIAN